MTKKNIAALTSGGVDSSVAIHLLVEQGYNPHLFYIKIGMDEKDDSFTCTMEEDMEMASSIAKKYNLELEVIDLHKEYWEDVINYTINKVKEGFTPNPDVMCNRFIKFGAFENKIGKDFDYIMSGHYATTIEDEDGKWLCTGFDIIKDQTDFLAQLRPWQLKKALFPIGNLPKAEVRRIAEENKLLTAKRKDSQGICFLGKINYNDFLEKYLGIKKGLFLEYETNKVLGEHRGYWFHTIGQRKGTGLSDGPWYVVSKNVEENIVYVSRNQELLNQETNIINLAAPNFLTKNVIPIIGNSIEVTFKIRHSPEHYKGIFSYNKYGWKLETKEKLCGIAAGQFCTIYDNNFKKVYGSSEIIL